MADSRKRIVLCRVAELPEVGSVGMSVETAEGNMEIFLVRTRVDLYGYLNRCPHTGINLDWFPNQFLDVTDSFIQCATHGALFRIEDGFCLRGPCAGEYLQKLSLQIEQDDVVLIRTI